MITDFERPVTAILVSGDIAFKGAADEYRTAMTWMLELAAVAGAPRERIFVVPGNHDVDRGVIQRTAATRNVQAAIARAENRERELRTQIMDADTGRALFAPIAAYNDFAKDLNCQVYLPERPYWKQDLELGHGVTLRIHGLTSTFLSGSNGEDDTRDSLYLSPLQTVLDPLPEVVNLVLCHHPPDWYIDHDAADEAICARAAIQMFGHKHRQRITREAQYVRFSAGAVNPDRQEVGWQPGYNFVDISVSNGEGGRELLVAAYLRQWQSNPERFRAILTLEDEPVFRHTIRLPGIEMTVREATGRPKPLSEAARGQAPTTAVVTGASARQGEPTMGDAITRNLVFRFWRLKSSERRDIALRLKLLTEAEMVGPESDRYGRALIRASEQGKLDELARQVAQKESQ